MKKTNKVFSVVLALIMLFSSFAVVAFAAEGDVTVSLRIEGIDSCFYYNNVTVPAKSTAYDVLVAADKSDESLTVLASASNYGAYVYSINGLTQGAYNKYDGWCYLVDGEDPGVSVGNYTVSNGETIVMYYGDPYGVGMQYPIMHADELKDGIVSFTSIDTTYDAFFCPTTIENLVLEYTLIWGYDGKTVELTPDENGVCKIPYKYLTIGEHSVQIEKYDEKTGLPTVLRYAPDETVEIGFIDGIMAFFKMIVEFITSLFA